MRRIKYVLERRLSSCEPRAAIVPESLLRATKWGPEHRLTMIEGHDAVQTWSHSSGCFFSITAAMPDAMEAAGKQVEVV